MAENDNQWRNVNGNNGENINNDNENQSINEENNENNIWRQYYQWKEEMARRIVMKRNVKISIM